MPKTETKTENTLENFAGFNNESDIDFFETGPAEETQLDDVTKKVETDDVTTDPITTPEEGKKKLTEEEEEIEKIDFFDTDDDPDTSETTSDDDDPNLPEEVYHMKTLNYLKEKGLLEYELEDGQELTEELAEQIVEENFDERIESRVEELFAEVPASVKNIVKYAIDGGDVGTLLSSMAKQNASSVKEDMDMEDEDNQILIVKTQRIAEGDDSETAEAYTEFLKESGKLKGVAEKVHTGIIAKQKQALKTQFENAAIKRTQDKKNQRLFKNELTVNVSKAQNLHGMSISKVDKRELPGYMADRTIKLEDGRQVTAMQRDIFKAMQDKDTSIILAKLLKNNFDFSGIIKGAKTKYTKEIKRDITRSDGIVKKNQTTAPKKKDLASYF